MKGHGASPNRLFPMDCLFRSTQAHAKRRRFVATAGLLLLFSAGIITTAHAQSAQDLQAQLQQMREEYEKKIAEMEGRIQQLEQSNQAIAAATRENTVSVTDLRSNVAALPPPEAADKLTRQQRTEIEQQQLATTPRYDELMDSDKVVQELALKAKAFEFHGYLRSGSGLNGEGGQMVAFQAPGAAAKYRLGNEAETYGEMILVNNWINPEHDQSKTWMKTEVLVEANTTQSSTFASNDEFRFREAFIQVGNVLESQPNAKFWAGERYYRRQNIDIDDFYILDMTGYGGGIEDVNLNFAQFAAAYLGGARDDLITDNGAYPKSSIDLRLYGIKSPWGKLGVWYDYAFSKGGTTADNTQIPSVGGWALGVGHTRRELFGGYNQVSLQYGVGAAANFSTGVEYPTLFLPNSHTFRFTDSAVLQPNKSFAIQPLVIYQRQFTGNPLDGTNTWLSFGARPVFFFTDHVSLAVEAGFDKTHSGTGQYDGWLRKITIAPQIGAGREFFSRPVLRAFVTYANWSEGLKGYVGGVPYKDKTAGFSFGLQGETWW